MKKMLKRVEIISSSNKLTKKISRWRLLHKRISDIDKRLAKQEDLLDHDESSKMIENELYCLKQIRDKT